MDFKKYRSSLKQYLSSKGFKTSSSPMLCFNPEHNNTHTPACIIKTETFDCKSCGIHGDVYDACKILTGIEDRAGQYKEVEQTLGGYTAPPEPKKERFAPDKNAVLKLIDYMRNHAGREKGVSDFLKQRGYTDEISKKMLGAFGYWPGFEIASKEIGIDVLKKAGVPLINPEKGYSSWDHSGAVEKLGKGLKLNFYVNGKCEKRGSKCCYTFPMFSDIEKIPVIILVEAEITAIAMRAIGFANTFPTGGTNGLTEKSIKEFLLDKQEIIFAFDGDDAGRKSSGIIPLDEKDSKKSYPDLLLKLGYQGIIRIAHLPDKKDPDDLIRENKIEMLSLLITGAPSYELQKEIKATEEKKQTGINDPPFLILGCDEKAYYAMPKNQNIPIRIARGDTSIKNWLKEIAPGSWWFENFQKLDEDEKVVYDLSAAMAWFREQMQERGIYDDDRLRGLGAHFEGKEIIFNTGSELYFKNKILSYNEYKGENIYCRSKINIKIQGKPWNIDEGVNFLRQLKTFSFERLIDYICIIGFVAVSPFASILTRRPHIWIIGKKGSGKTTLAKEIMYSAVGKKQSFYNETGVTEAAIRQECGKDCRIIFLDEFESQNQEDITRTNQVMKLARSSYSGESIPKGGSDHKVIKFLIRNMFCFISVNFRFTNDADRSRVVVCKMKSKPDNDNTYYQEIESFEGLRKRIFEKIKDINKWIAKSKLMILKLGFDSRTADTYSPLVVGFWMVISDNDFFEGDEKIQEYIKKAIMAIKDSDSRNDEDKILERIFQERIRIKPDVELTIAEMLTLCENDSIGGFAKLQYDEQIRRYGLRRCDVKGRHVLAIDSDDHPAIKAILKDTPFSEYKEILQRHDAVIHKSQSVRMSGKNTRCIILDWEKLNNKYFKEDSSEEIPF